VGIRPGADTLKKIQSAAPTSNETIHLSLNDITLAAHQSVSTGLLQYGESDGFSQWQMIAKTLNDPRWLIQ
jgi:hypothetical protein